MIVDVEEEGIKELQEYCLKKILYYKQLLTSLREEVKSPSEKPRKKRVVQAPIEEIPSGGLTNEELEEHAEGITVLPKEKEFVDTHIPYKDYRDDKSLQGKK